LLLASVFKHDVELTSRILLDPARDANAAWLRQGLQACRHVYTVAIDIVAVEDDIADIDADAKLDSLLRFDLAVALGHAALDFYGAAQSADYAGELCQEPVASGLHDPPAMFRYFGIDEVAQMRFQPGKGALLVCAHQPAVTGHIGGKDSGKPALNAIFGHVLPSRLKAAVQQTVVVLPRAVYRDGYLVWVNLGDPAVPTRRPLSGQMRKRRFAVDGVLW
jgi:hypothetical protein